MKVLFLSDLFDKLNSLNSGLQGPSENIITATSKLRTLDEKLTLGKTKVSKKVFDLFPALNESTRKQEIFPQIMNTLSGLQLALQYYFPEFAVNNFRCVVNPIGSNESSNLSAEEEE